MMSRQRLTDSEISERLARLEGWAHSGNKLEKTYDFRDFSEAFGWMTRAALAAEKKNHHPDWSNSWSKVAVALSTHDAGGITALDFELAEEFDRLLPR